jgi:hypothetical protein
MKYLPIDQMWNELTPEQWNELKPWEILLCNDLYGKQFWTRPVWTAAPPLEPELAAIVEHAFSTAREWCNSQEFRAFALANKDLILSR